MLWGNICQILLLMTKSKWNPIPPEEYICIHLINFLYVRFGHLWSPKMDGDLTYCIRHHRDNALMVKRVCYLATGKYKTTPLRRQICLSLQATSSATVGPVRKVADQMGKWKSQCFSTFKPVAIYTLESRSLEDSCVIFSHLSYQFYLQEGDVSKGLERTMVVFSQVPLSQPSTDSMFNHWVIYSGNWLTYGFPLRYKATIGGSSLTPIRSTSCEPRNINSYYVDIFIHMLVAIWRCVFL